MGFYVEYDPKGYKPKPKMSEREEWWGSFFNILFTLAGIAAFIWLVVKIVRDIW